MAVQLDAGFWRAFYEENWVGDRPRVIKNAFEGAIADDHELLTGLKNLRAMLEAHPESIYTLFLGRERIADELHRWLPEKEEHSFDEYWARIERKANPRELFLHVYPFHAHAPEQFGRRFRVWLNNLQAFTEIRTQDVAVELFFGNYRKSLVGVHRDTNAVFCFVARGRKRFRVWPRDVFTFDTPYPFLFDYDEHLRESILLEGEAGDVFFWPSSYWHIAEADDDLSISFSLSVAQPQPDMNDWNLDPDEYDRVTEPLIEDIPFFVERAKRSGGPVRILKTS